jgi:hypothetical protein
LVNLPEQRVAGADAEVATTLCSPLKATTARVDEAAGNSV